MGNAIPKIKNLYETVLLRSVVLGFTSHLFWVIAFFYMEINMLAYVNIVSCFIYLCGILLIKRGYFIFYLLTALLSTAFAITFDNVYLGAGAGFQYYLFIFTYAIFITPFLKRVHCLFLFTLNLLFFLALHFYTSTPIVHISDTYLQIIYTINIIIIFCTIGFLSNYFRNHVNQSINQLHKTNDRLEQIANTDELTGLYNRRTMYEKLASQIISSEKNGEVFSIIITDIDDFKLFNDKYGHGCGDLVLIEFSSIIRDHFGDRGIVSRWGGEEFLIFLSNTTELEAYQLAESLRKKMNDHLFLYQNLELRLSLTIGIATYDEDLSISSIINRADQKLLLGKKEGKNKVRT